MAEKKFYQSGSNFAIGIVLIAAGVVSILLHFAYLPLIGLPLGIIAIIFGIFFLRRSRRKLKESEHGGKAEFERSGG